MVRQIDKRPVVEIDYFADHDRRIYDRFVLTEFTVGDVQIPYIHPLKGHMSARDRLRVLHRYRDEVVEAYIFDIESLAHLGAART